MKYRLLLEIQSKEELETIGRFLQSLNINTFGLPEQVAERIGTQSAWNMYEDMFNDPNGVDIQEIDPNTGKEIKQYQQKPKDIM